LSIVFLHITLTKKYSVLKCTNFYIGLFCGSIIAGTWYVSQFLIYGNEFLRSHFSFIFSKAFSEGSFNLATFLFEWAEYPWLLIVYYEPWLILMLIGMYIHGKRIYSDRDVRSILLFTWFFSILLVFSLFDAKVLRYIMPIFSVCALFSATPLSDWIEKIGRKKYLMAGYATLCLIVVLIVSFPNPRFRAKDMIKVSAVIDSNTPTNMRVILYTFGALHYNYNNQLLWYTNRFTRHIVKEEKLREILKGGEGLTYVVDGDTFKKMHLGSRSDIEILTRSEKFVAFKTTK